MTKTNTKNWCLCFLQSLLQSCNSFIHNSWITRTVGDEQTVVLFFSEIIVPRNNQQFNTSSDKASNLVILHTNINNNNSNWFAVLTQFDIFFRSIQNWLLNGNFVNQILNIWIIKFGNFKILLPITGLVTNDIFRLDT